MDYIVGFTTIGLIIFLMCSQAAHCQDRSSTPLKIEINREQNHTASIWLESSLNRIFKTSPPTSTTCLELLAARNTRVSFQVSIKNNGYSPISVECTLDSPDEIHSLIRRVGYVPMRDFTWHTSEDELDGIGHLPGLVPDPLIPENRAVLHNQAVQPFWVTLDIPAECDPGTKLITVNVQIDGVSEPVALQVTLDVKQLVVLPRKDFPVTHWWNADALYHYYKIEPFGDTWFEIAEAYLSNMLAHGSNVIFVPLFHHRREVVKEPAQLLIVDETEPGTYTFDWTRVRRFIHKAKKIGFDYYEWPHFWQMKITRDGHIVGAAEPARVYTLINDTYHLIVPDDSPALSDSYVNFLKQFLPALHEFLVEEQLETISFYHASDEPGGNKEDFDNYMAVREKLSELAPWTDGKVMDAMSDIRYGELDLMDIPVPNVQAATDFINKKIPHWVYYCTGPVGPYINRFFDTPLIKVRMSGLLFYKLDASGFLHWGYNYWYAMDLGHNPVPQDFVDPWNGGQFMPYGDGHVVYPGPAGPVDSIRWEIFAEALQDYAILQSAGIDREDPILDALIDYGNFPKSESWLNDVIKQILSRTE